MKISNPRFDEFGEVHCEQCPVEEVKHCLKWLRKNKNVCPGKDTYKRACELAEEVK